MCQVRTFWSTFYLKCFEKQACQSSRCVYQNSSTCCIPLVPELPPRWPDSLLPVASRRLYQGPLLGRSTRCLPLLPVTYIRAASSVARPVAFRLYQSSLAGSLTRCSPWPPVVCIRVASAVARVVVSRCLLLLVSEIPRQ